MKRLMTEKASSDAFRPTASIRNTAESEPNNAPSASKLPGRKNRIRGRFNFMYGFKQFNFLLDASGTEKLALALGQFRYIRTF